MGTWGKYLPGQKKKLLYTTDQQSSTKDSSFFIFLTSYNSLLLIAKLIYYNLTLDMIIFYKNMGGIVCFVDRQKLLDMALNHNNLLKNKSSLYRECIPR